jgi:ubiquinone/menaquinone biosynthesis C-methylase UbiE
MSQKEIFLESEGDGWYKRNSKAIDSQSPEIEKLVQYLRPFKSEITSILEIGCADGSKSLYIAQQLDSEVYGIDPSTEAIIIANEKLHNTEKTGRFLKATADKIPFEDNSIDLIHFGFCLYLVDRDLLKSVIGEAIRVLRPETGYISIFDFDVAKSYENNYRHRLGVKSFKDDYSKIFSAAAYFH